MLGTSRPTRWMTPSPGSVLPEGVVEVWRADLDAPHDDLLELLSDRERERAGRFRSELARRRWTRSRGVLRSILARSLQCDPRALRFEVDERGKPVLQEPCTARAPAREARARCTPLSETPPHSAHSKEMPLSELTSRPDHGEAMPRFNISHSGPVALIALSATQAVGVDVEVPHRQIDEVALAARVLGEAEARRLSALTGQARTREFMRAWVAHEATVKCLGGGLSAPVPADARSGVWLRELDVGVGAAALAVEGPQCEVQCLQWT